MSGYRTSQDIRDEYIRQMGKSLGLFFDRLWQELAWLYTKWDEYVELFAKNPERVALLNEAAPNFFGIVQNVMWEDCIVHVARLTDPPQSGRRENLTIRALPDLVSPQFEEEIKTLVTEARKNAEFCRDWRNRRNAHHDCALALGDDHAEPLEHAS